MATTLMLVSLAGAGQHPRLDGGRCQSDSQPAEEGAYPYGIEGRDM